MEAVVWAAMRRSMHCAVRLEQIDMVLNVMKLPDGRFDLSPSVIVLGDVLL